MVQSDSESGDLLEIENIIPEGGEDREGKNKRDVQRSTERRRVRATSILSSCIIHKLDQKNLIQMGYFRRISG